MVDAVVKDGTTLPEFVQSNLRNLLVACELGELVLIQCIRKDTDEFTYALCALTNNGSDKARLLPICEIENTPDIMSRMRPPSVLPESMFAKAAHTGEHVVRAVKIDDDNGNSSDSLH